MTTLSGNLAIGQMCELTLDYMPVNTSPDICNQVIPSSSDNGEELITQMLNVATILNRSQPKGSDNPLSYPTTTKVKTPSHNNLIYSHHDKHQEK